MIQAYEQAGSYTFVGLVASEYAGYIVTLYDQSEEETEYEVAVDEYGYFQIEQIKVPALEYVTFTIRACQGQMEHVLY